MTEISNAWHQNIALFKKKRGYKRSLKAKQIEYMTFFNLWFRTHEKKIGGSSMFEKSTGVIKIGEEKFVDVSQTS